MSRKILSVLVVMLTGASSACQTNTQSGALIGGLGGAGIGAAIGSNNGSAGRGALIGGAAGAVGGGLIGNSMDRNETKAEKARREDARVADKAVRITHKDVMAWSEDGVSDEIIIDRIERSGEVFRMSGRDENNLRDHGVSEEVIDSMRNTWRRSTRAE